MLAWYSCCSRKKIKSQSSTGCCFSGVAANLHKVKVIALAVGIKLLAAAKVFEAFRRQLSLKMNDCRLLFTLINLWG